MCISVHEMAVLLAGDFADKMDVPNEDEGKGETTASRLMTFNGNVLSAFNFLKSLETSKAIALTR